MSDSVLQSWEYLENELQGAEFFRLYQHPASALAIFRKRLTDLAKSFVMAMLYMKVPLSVPHLELWVKSGNKRERENAVSLLERYQIFQAVKTRSQSRAYKLTPNFAESLRQALTGGGKNQSFGTLYTSPDKTHVTVDTLDTFARNQWEGILSYMVGNTANIELDASVIEHKPSSSVVELLRTGNFIQLFGKTAKITKEGFAFVLQDINSQVWALLFLYVDNAERLGMTKVECLSFLFLVASLELGQAYSAEGLSETERRILLDLYDFGIIYQPSTLQGTSYFYPTRLAVALTSDSSSVLASVNSSLSSSLGSSSSASTAGGGFIIIETNYRLYAYTSSPLQISLLALFVNLRSRHPNLVTGKMTKRSIQRAVQMGITADQIISYLSAHAHPQMRRYAALQNSATSTSTSASTATGQAQPHSSILPPTIIDQVNLWQIERDRMTAANGFLFKDFPSKDEYEKPMRYADELGVLIWKSDAKQMFFVSRHEGVAAYMKQRREGSA
ncbi:MAG: hypothetical protein Q9160_006544 [Pyrenula sp. 1 TL-2023]